MALSTIRRSRWVFSTTAELTIRGGGMPYSTLALDADRENGPAARSFAADAHDCIMVRINILPHTSLWHEDARQWRAPLGSFNRPTDNHHQTPKLCKKPCRSSSSRRVLRRQGAA